MVTHLEVERTYEPAPDAGAADLAALPVVASVGDARRDELEAVYFDTPDLGLVRAGVSLRRRTGGADAGWHLKIPSGTGRTEIQLPPGHATRTPPQELRDVVVGWTRGAPLTEVATIRTVRTTYPLLDDHGGVLAELADDEVTGTRADGVVTTWREWELELVSGDTALLESADRLLSEGGTEPAAVSRKIARVLGDQVPAPVRLRRPKPRKPATRVVHARLAAQVDELARRDVQVRRGESEGVHNARIACRRLRTALATFRPLLDREQTDPIRDEIGWLAGELSDARDAIVVGERLRGLLEQEPAELVVGPVARRLHAGYGSIADVPDAMCSERYFALRHDLDRLVADPPWSGDADLAARDVLPPLVGRDWQRLRQRYDACADADDRDVALHEVRKAAKRLRYAAETVRPVVGKDAKRLAKAAKALTSYLGERQDTVVCRAHLRALADAAAADGEPTFTYGRLHALEQERAEELDRGLPQVWDRLTGPATRWTC